jgi:AcrR family transcriptional regulator
VSDEEVFAAAHRATMRLAPADLTLAAIATEAGVTAAALAQRFGSKRSLLLALATKAAEGAGGVFDELRAAHGSPLAVVRAYADCLAGLAESPAVLARNLAYLQIDLTDPEFGALLAAQARTTRAALIDLLSAAVRARELTPRTDPRALARTVETVLSGSLLTWACYQEGPVGRWIRADLEAVVAPYCTPRRRRSTTRRRGATRIRSTARPSP